MIEIILLFVLILPYYPPVSLVQDVYQVGGIELVALVSCENPTWDSCAIRDEGHGFTSYGLCQIDNEWWLQHRGDLRAHIAEGWYILHVRFKDDPAKYNGGDHPNAKALAWGRHVRARQRSLELYLWRHLR